MGAWRTTCRSSLLPLLPLLAAAAAAAAGAAVSQGAPTLVLLGSGLWWCVQGLHTQTCMHMRQVGLLPRAAVWPQLRGPTHCHMPSCLYHLLTGGGGAVLMSLAYLEGPEGGGTPAPPAPPSAAPGHGLAFAAAAGGVEAAAAAGLSSGNASSSGSVAGPWRARGVSTG